jgi:hypothetical protein
MTLSATPISFISTDELALHYVLLLSIPLRREFNFSLDRRRFFLEMDYAEEVLTLGLSSKEERLQKYSQYLTDKIFAAGA